MLIDYKIIDDEYYITVNFKYIESLDELLFRNEQPLYSARLKKCMIDTLYKCNIKEIEGYLYNIPDKKIILLGTYKLQDKKIPYSYSWKRIDGFGCDKFWKENILFYDNYDTPKNILFYFKLKNKKDFAKFKLAYKDM